MNFLPVPSCISLHLAIFPVKQTPHRLNCTPGLCIGVAGAVSACRGPCAVIRFIVFSVANLALAGFSQTNALGENLPSRYLNMFNLRLCNAATIWYFILKFGHLHLCGKGYNYFSPHCCKCNSFGGIAAIICANACHEPHSNSVYSGSEHRQFNSPSLVKREAGFPSRRRALIGSYQLWRVNDSPYYRE